MHRRLKQQEREREKRRGEALVKTPLTSPSMSLELRGG